MSVSRTQISLAFATMLLPLAAGRANAQTGSIVGTVYDSIADAPLADAAVFLWDTPIRAVTDASGAYRIDDVPPGDYSILFFHTLLGEMGVSPGPRPITVEADGEHPVDLATPSLGTVVKSQCLMIDRPEGSGAIAGRVLDGESRVPLGGAFVRLSWEEEGRREPRAAELNAGPDGAFTSCLVPEGVPVLVSAEFYGRQSSRREITVSDGGFERVDVDLLDQGASHVTTTLVDNETELPVEGAEAWIRGTEHRALSDGDGHFQFDDVPPGTYMLVTDHLAYGTKMDTLVVPPDQRLLVEMRLDTRPIPMAPLTVTAESAPVERARRRGGIVITREDIDKVRQQSRDASDVIRSLHIPGVIVRHQSNGVICVGYSTGQVKLNQTGCVEMMIYINDVRATDADMALRLPPDAIERMQIFKPVEAGNLFGLGAGNGVWMIYTRGN